MITMPQRKKEPVLHRITGERSDHARIFNYQKCAHGLTSLEGLNVAPMFVG